MTAAQTSIALKGTRSYAGVFAAVVMALIVAVVVVAISARPLAAPATTTANPVPLTMGHDEGRFTVPLLTSGHDEARPSSVQSSQIIPYQANQLHSAAPVPTVPLAPRGGGSDRGK